MWYGERTGFPLQAYLFPLFPCLSNPCLYPLPLALFSRISYDLCFSLSLVLLHIHLFCASLLPWPCIYSVPLPFSLAPASYWYTPSLSPFHDPPLAPAPYLCTLCFLLLLCTPWSPLFTSLRSMSIYSATLPPSPGPVNSAIISHTFLVRTQ